MLERRMLRSWLRQAPQPAAIRIRNDQDEERDIALDENMRRRWVNAESAVTGARAVVVECLDAKGKIIRSTTLETEDAVEGSSGARSGPGGGQLGVKDIAAIIDRVGYHVNAAHEKGREAASETQEQMLQIVQLLAVNYANAMTSLHNSSINLANALAGKEGEEVPKSQESMDRLLGTLAAVAVGGGPVQQPAHPNGKKG